MSLVVSADTTLVNYKARLVQQDMRLALLASSHRFYLSAILTTKKASSAFDDYILLSMESCCLMISEVLEKPIHELKSMDNHKRLETITSFLHGTIIEIKEGANSGDNDLWLTEFCELLFLCCCCLKGNMEKLDDVLQGSCWILLLFFVASSTFRR